ncbi:MAG: hypothetical protein M1815_000477 [Lichina confinis]|nr:MAG: hypothetical protein M1815_000477 [Lichina confinis]
MKAFRSHTSRLICTHCGGRVVASRRSREQIQQFSQLASSTASSGRRPGGVLRGRAAWTSVTPPGRVHRATATRDESSGLDEAVQDLIQRGDILLNHSGAVPTEGHTQSVFEMCRALATTLAGAQKQSSGKAKGGIVNSASALLYLEKGRKRTGRQSPATAASEHRKKLVDEVSDFAYHVITQPQVFISPWLLKTYVTIQTLLGRPDSLPEIFDLYANKPVPQAKTDPVRYKPQNPKRAKSAVPADLATAALNSAIESRDMALALDIVHTTFARPAFVRAKVIRRAFLPGVAVGLTPAAAYVVASQFAAQQLAGDGYLSANVAWAGMLAYLGFTGTLGFVALTTANDHMERVTWVPGTPLRERWLREEERAALDKVAGAWGFKELLRRGEEEGEEWEALREWIGSRGMLLDNENLMPGMQ